LKLWVRRFKRKKFGDAVVLIKAQRNSCDYFHCKNVSRSYQTSSVRVAVRPISQLNVDLPRTACLAPSCGGAELKVPVFLQDDIARPFSSLRGWKENSQQVFKVEVSHPELLRVTHSLPNGDDNGILTTLNLQAKGDPSRMGRSDSVFIPVTITLWLEDYPNVLPLYLRIDVADYIRCERPDDGLCRDGICFPLLTP